VSDVFGLSGAPTAVSYVWGPQGFDAFNPTECFGPTRYMWDLGLYLVAIVVHSQEGIGCCEQKPRGFIIGHLTRST
jgi:hypothetical protein